VIKKILWILTGTLLAIASSISFASNKNTVIYSGPSFKAQMRTRHKSNPEMRNLSDIWMSKHGLRVSSIGPAGRKMITLTLLNETFMLMPEQKKYIKSSEIEQQADNTSELPGGIFSSKPCNGYTRTKKENKSKIAGREVTKWFCGMSQGLDNTIEYFDETLKCVTKVEQPDGTIIELINIEQKSLPKKLFELPSGYQKMSFAQIMQPPGMDLSTYMEEIQK